MKILYKQFLYESINTQYGLIDYVGKNGIDKKLTTLDKELKKIKVFENTPTKIVYGTDKKQVVFTKETGEDKAEQLEFEEKILKKEIERYNGYIKEYYDKVFEYKFLNDVDSFRKAINNTIKFIANQIIILPLLKQ